jgi:hypothetical protein
MLRQAEAILAPIQKLGQQSHVRRPLSCCR